MSKNNTFETLLGLLVLVVSGLFIFYVYTSQHTVSGSQYTIHANFQKIDGINVGNDVKLSGVKVGTVSAVDVDVKNFQAKLSISIRNDLKIPTDSSLEIASEGLLGGKYVSITPGANEENVKPGGSLFQTVSSMSLENLLSKYLTSSGNNPNEPSQKDVSSNPQREEKETSKKAEKNKQPSKDKTNKDKSSTKKSSSKGSAQKNNSEAQLVNEDLFGNEDDGTSTPPPSNKKAQGKKNKKASPSSSATANEDQYFDAFSNLDNFSDTPQEKPKTKKKQTKQKSYEDDFSRSTGNEETDKTQNMPEDSNKFVEDLLNQSFAQLAPQTQDTGEETQDNADSASTATEEE